MKKLFKSTLAVLLVLTLLSSFSICFAAESKKTYPDYGSYVLLGDSVACGWSDIEERDTSFTRVEGSYGAFLADDLGVTLHPRACIGFRTLEMRYMFEDDYEGDRFMFYSIDQDRVDREIPAIRREVAEAGIVTLSVGGNDWGSYLGWHVYEEMDKFEDKNEEFLTKAREYLETNGTDADTVDSLIDIACLTGALPQIIQVLPGALEEGLARYKENWNIMIEDIYALNPDVTLVVVGMFDTTVQDDTMKEIDPVGSSVQAALTKIKVAKAIVDYANKPMKAGAEKYGYIFIDPIGTLCEKQHPSKAGHRHIADLILAALPDASFPFKDVDQKSDSYKAIETLYSKDIMAGTSATTFSPDAALSKSDLSSALAKISGVTAVSDTDGDVQKKDMAKALWDTVFSSATSTIKRLKTVLYVVNLLIGGGAFDFTAGITRAEGAKILCDYINL